MSQPPTPHDVRISRPEPIRQFERNGVLWTVYERPASVYTPRLTRELVFESPTEVRRARDCPANWYTLPLEELFALSRPR